MGANLRTLLCTGDGHGFVTTKELRAESGKVWAKLEAGEDIVITRNGKPFALMVHTEASRMESDLRAIRAERFPTPCEKSSSVLLSRGWTL